VAGATAVSVVLPTYNEREGAAALCSELLTVTRAAQLSAELLVIDDESPDGTGAHVADVFRSEPAVRVVVRRGQRGLATAIRRGLSEASGDVLVIMDADGNHDPALVPLMVRYARDFDVIVGSRFVLGGGMPTSPFRYSASYIFNLLLRFILGLRVRDSLSGYLAFRRSLLARLPMNAIFHGYGDYAIRLLYQVSRDGRRILEVPTVYRPRKGGASKTRFVPYAATCFVSAMRLRLTGR
jgi:dolichol-phosphate mannosyltransferase